MKIQSINPQMSAMRPQCVRNVQKMDSSNVSFKNYKSAVKKIVSTRFENGAEVSRAFQKLYIILEKEGKIIDAEAKKILDDYFAAFNTTGFLNKIGAPIREMDSRLRDFVIRLEKNDIVVMEKDQDNFMNISHHGKRGFLNSFFDIQSAKQDVRMKFYSGENNIEFAVTDEGGFRVEQNFGRYRAISKYSSLIGWKEISHKEEDCSLSEIFF